MNRCLQAFVGLGVFTLAATVLTPSTPALPAVPIPSPSPVCSQYVPGHDLNSIPAAQLFTGPAPSMNPALANANTPPTTVGPLPTVNPAAQASDAASGTASLKAGNYAAASGCPNGAPENNVSGTLLEQLYQAANAFRGTDTCWALTNCGQDACAAAVQRIVQIVTHTVIGSYSVDDWRNLATSGAYGGTIVPASQAKRGAIIIWPQLEDPVLGHIGFCATDGCTQTWSNSSSKHQFAPQTWGIYFDGTYSTYLIWEPARIP